MDPVNVTETVPADAAGIARAVELLLAGEVVAVPTETVYGLAARAADAGAVARIYAAKGRPSFNPLIVHVADAGQAATLVHVGAVAARLMAAHWPGPLTLVLPIRADADIAAAVRAGLPTLAVRCPAHPVMQALIAAAGPLAAPSANSSGRLSPTRASHVAASLGGRIPLILDGGPCSAGLESTILGIDGEAMILLREGAIPSEALGVTRIAAGGVVTAPGQLDSHYAPRLPLRTNVQVANAQEFHVGFGAISGDRSLSAAGDLDEAAARLFDVLHAAEASGRVGIAVAPIPRHGLGAAINDRLRRASATPG